MSSDWSRSRERRLAAVAALCLSVLSGSAQAPSLRVVSAGPTGDLTRLADAEQVRIVFSEPMIALGTIPSNTTPPWIRITPAVAGTFYWSGTKTLIFSPDASTPLPFATTFTVRVDAAATSVTGRAMEQPYEFTFATPTVRLLAADWYRKTGRFDSAVVLILRFNQPVRPADVLAHAHVTTTPHPWTAPELSADARERLRQTDPAGLARFDDKVASVRRVSSSSEPVAVRLAESWDESRFAATPEQRRARDDRRPSAGCVVDDCARRHAAEPARPAHSCRSFDRRAARADVLRATHVVRGGVRTITIPGRRADETCGAGRFCPGVDRRRCNGSSGRAANLARTKIRWSWR